MAALLFASFVPVGGDCDGQNCIADGVSVVSAASPNFRIVDVRAEYGQLIVEVQHFNSDGSHWFFEDYTFQGREEFKRPRVIDTQGRLFLDTYAEAPKRSSSGQDEYYLPTGAEWLRSNRPHLDSEGILSVIQSVHEQREVTGWSKGRFRLTVTPLDGRQDDRRGAAVLAARFQGLEETAYRVTEDGTYMAVAPPPPTDIPVGTAWGTVSTFFPDLNPESTSVDGRLQYVNLSGEDWSLISAQTASSSAQPTADDGQVQIRADTSTDKWDVLERPVFLFDTSALPDNDVISAATFSVVGSTAFPKSDDFTSSIALVSSAPAANTDLVVGDFGSFGTTDLATRVTIADYANDDSTFNDFTLIEEGITAISKTGVTKYGLRISNDVDNSEPSWGASQSATVGVQFAEETLSGDKRPKLVVIHEAPVTVTAPDDITVEAEGPSGTPDTNLAIAAFLAGASAVDDQGDPVAVSNSAPGTFPLGPTVVIFSATDTDGNTGTATATVTVEDTTSPVVTPPADITIQVNVSSQTSGAAATNGEALGLPADTTAVEESRFGIPPESIGRAPKPTGTPSGVPGDSSFVGFVSNQIVGSFKEPLRQAIDQVVVSEFEADAALNALGDLHGVTRIDKQFPGSENRSRPWRDLAQWHVINFSSDVDVEAIAREFKLLPGIEDAQPIGIHQLDDIPNDSFFDFQWFLDQANDVDIDAPEAWSIEDGDEELVVAILDSGVRYFHKDLGGANAEFSPGVPDPATIDGNVWRNMAEINGVGGLDDDGNGRIDDFWGWDFVEGGVGCWPGEDCSTQDNDPRDFNGHGTHVAGIVSALTNNGYAAAGIAGGFGNGTHQASGDGVKIMPLRIGASFPHPQDPSLEIGLVNMAFAAQALYYAAENGARLANGSWGSSNTGGLGAAMDAFIAAGGLFFNSAGNNNDSNPSYLASRSDVISVASTAEDDQKSSFSNFGPWVDISAPGNDIGSLFHVHADEQTDYYSEISGTSMASPAALGVAALIWSANPEWTAEQVKQRLFSTAENIDALNPGFAGQLGAGRVNAFSAVAPTVPNTNPAVSDYLTAASAVDVVDGVLPVTNDAPTEFPLGATTVTFSATDSAGNHGTAQATVTVVLTNAPPLVTPPVDITVEAEGPTGTPSSSQKIIDFLAAASAFDLEDGTVAVTNNAPGVFPLGITTVIFSATDSEGDTDTATATVTVVDTTAPDLSPPADVTDEATGPTTPVALGTPTVSDLADPSPTITNDAPVGNLFPLGVTVVTWTATDSEGNAASATQTVTVVDTTPPDVTAPANLTVEATGVTTVVALGSPTVSDLVDPSPTTSIDVPVGNLFPVGVTLVTWTATDSEGNAATAAQTVTVVDTTPPDVTAPANLIVEAAGPTTPVALSTPTVSDLVDPSPSVTNDSPVGGLFPVGVTVVTWTATDSEGNAATATQTVTVLDTTAPNLSPPADVLAEATGVTTVVALGSPFVSDLVDLSPTISNDAPLGDLFPVGVTVVTWTATDSEGNAATATQTVTVVDTTPPDVTAPANLIVEATGVTTVVALGSPTVNDLVDPSPIVSNDAPLGDLFPVGVTVVTWTAVDSEGNAATATQTITVVDSPTLNITAPTDLSLEAGAATTFVVLGAPTVSDPSTTVTNDAPVGDLFPIGVTVVTWTATDSGGNSANASQTVTVVDTTAPDVVAPANLTVEATGPATVVALGLPSVNDLVDPSPTVSNDSPVGDLFPLGPTIVNWTAADDLGNSSTATQTVTVVDTTPPEIIGLPVDIFVTPNTPDGTPATSQAILGFLGEASAQDLVDGAVTVSNNAPALFLPGTTIVIFSATDLTGNTGWATATVTVMSPIDDNADDDDGDDDDRDDDGDDDDDDE